MAQWNYVENEQAAGPVSSTELVALFRSGRILPETLVWKDGLTDWVPLSSQLQALGVSSPLLDAPPPAPPPSPPADEPSQKPVAAAASDNPYAPPRAEPSHREDALGAASRIDAHAVVMQAGFIRRWAALIVDTVILALPLGFIAVLLMGGISLAGGLDGDSVGAIQSVYYLLYFIAAPLYYAGLESSAHQATLGKRALGIKVVDRNGERLSFLHALGRWLAAGLSYLIFYIGFLMAAFTEKKQALHDLIASTYVVDRWAYTSHPERQKDGASGCLVAALIGIFIVIPALGIFLAILIPAIAGR